jgi:hypothetical protein
VSTSLHEQADLAKHLERWVDEELISRAEADAIARFEARGQVAPHRISLITEAIGYVGAALLFAAGWSLLGRFWEDMDELARIAVLTIATLVLLGLGWPFRASAEPALGRLAGVLWVGAVATAAWLAGVIAIDVGDWNGRVPSAAAGLTATAVALPLYAIRRKALQHVALFGAATWGVAAVFLVEDSVVPAVAVWVFAAAWTVGALLRLLPPERAAYGLGGAATLIAASIVSGVSDAGLWLGLATSAGLLVASVIKRQSVLLGFGVVGLFVFLVRTLQEYLGGGAGMAFGLAVSGLVVLAIALFLSRRTARRPMGS